MSKSDDDDAPCAQCGAPWPCTRHEPLISYYRDGIGVPLSALKPRPIIPAEDQPEDGDSERCPLLLPVVGHDGLPLSRSGAQR